MSEPEKTRYLLDDPTLLDRLWVPRQQHNRLREAVAEAIADLACNMPDAAKRRLREGLERDGEDRA